MKTKLSLEQIDEIFAEMQKSKNHGIRVNPQAYAALLEMKNPLLALFYRAERFAEQDLWHYGKRPMFKHA